VRLWAAQQGINDAAHGTLNSWALALLVAFHLQTRPQPILPPLSKLVPEFGQQQQGRFSVGKLFDIDTNVIQRLGAWCAAGACCRACRRGCCCRACRLGCCPAALCTSRCERQRPVIPG
jgi:hypothetical protein